MNILRTGSVRYFGAVAFLAALYFGMAHLSISIPGVQDTVSPVWPPAGINLAALLLLGLRLWPGIAIGEFLFERSVGLPLALQCSSSLGVTLEALLGVALLRRIGLGSQLSSLRDVLGLLLLAAPLSTTLSATIGLSGLCLGGLQPWNQFGVLWWTWWLGDVMAILLVTPVLLSWSHWPHLSRKPQRVIETIVWLLLLLGISWIVFGSQSTSALASYPLEYLPFPFVVWAAFRLGQRGTTLATLLVSSIAIWGAAHRSGPFFAHATNPVESILSLQTFMGVVAVTGLVLGATVTERHQVQNSLQESEASLVNAQHIAHLGNWDLDVVKQELRWSDEIYRILGFTPKAFAPSQEVFLKSVHPDDQESFRQLMDGALFEKKPFSIDWRIVLPDGQERIVQATCEIIWNQAGSSTRITGTIQDVTEQKRIEKALQSSEAEYRELAHTLELKVIERTLELKEKNETLAKSLQTLKATQQQLIQAEKMSSLGQMVAGIGHEINNPVNFIHGNLDCTNNYVQDLLGLILLYKQEYPNSTPAIQERTETIELDFLADDLPKTLSSMKNGTERIRQIVLSLRNFSRLDEADVKLANIHEGIDSTLVIIKHRLKEGVEVIKKYGELPLVECYPAQMNQVFMNILSNALDTLLEQAEQPNKQIVICTSTVDSHQIQVRICDNGSGIPPEIKDKIFDPFFTTKDVGKGTGLGLSISYQIVKNHQGRIEVISQPGKGTEFVLTFPIKQR